MSQYDHATTVVATVNSIPQREEFLNNIYENLTKEHHAQLTVIKDSINRVKIFHEIGNGRRVLVRTYIVIVIPIHIDLTPLHDIQGAIDFHLDETIALLQRHVSNLQSMQGYKVVRGDKHGATLKQLVRGLSATNGEYRASKTV